MFSYCHIEFTIMGTPQLLELKKKLSEPVSDARVALLGVTGFSNPKA